VTDPRPRARRYLTPPPQLLVAGLLLAMLAGCASLPEQTLEQPHWQLRGKLAVLSPRGSGSGQLDWKMTGNQFEITLRGPLGTGAVRLSGSPAAAQLSRGGETLSGSFSQLAAPLFGAAVPIEALQHWADGRPAPAPLAAASQLRYDHRQRLAGFEQAGWQISLSHYNSATALPAKLVGRRADERFTLLVQSRGGQ